MSFNVNVFKAPEDMASPEAANLFSFFRSAFGPDEYRGDTALAKKILEADTVIALDLQNENEAMAIVQNGRILVPGTKPDQSKGFTRRDKMVALLNACWEHGVSQYITIGLKYANMQRAASLAGLQRVACGECIGSALSSTGERDRYDIVDILSSWELHKTNENGRVYKQELWSKSPIFCYNNADEHAA